MGIGKKELGEIAGKAVDVMIVYLEEFDLRLSSETRAEIIEVIECRTFRTHFSEEEIADALGVKKAVVRNRAIRGQWTSKRGRLRSGRGIVLYALDGLPLPVRTKLLNLSLKQPDSL